MITTDRPTMVWVTLGVTALHAALLAGLPSWQSRPAAISTVLITRAVPPPPAPAPPQAAPVPPVPEPAVETPAVPMPTPQPTPAPLPRGKAKPDAQVKPPSEPVAPPADRPPEQPATGTSGKDSGSLIETAPGVLAGPVNYTNSLASKLPEADVGVVTGTIKSQPDQPVALPRPVRITYVASGKFGEHSFSVPATLTWRHVGSQYNLNWELLSATAGDRMFASLGVVTSQGLAPVSHSESTNSQRTDTRFDYASAQLTRTVTPIASTLATSTTPATAPATRASVPASAPTLPAMPFTPGLQDLLSQPLQLAALVGANPDRFTPGTTLKVPVLSDGKVRDDSFVVLGTELLTALDGKSARTLHLQRVAAVGEPTMDVWLAPSLDHMPLRWRSVLANGDVIDQLAQRAYELQPEAPAR